MPRVNWWPVEDLSDDSEDVEDERDTMEVGKREAEVQLGAHQAEEGGTERMVEEVREMMEKCFDRMVLPDMSRFAKEYGLKPETCPHTIEISTVQQHGPFPGGQRTPIANGGFGLTTAHARGGLHADTLRQGTAPILHQQQPSGDHFVFGAQGGGQGGPQGAAENIAGGSSSRGVLGSPQDSVRPNQRNLKFDKKKNTKDLTATVTEREGVPRELGGRGQVTSDGHSNVGHLTTTQIPNSHPIGAGLMAVELVLNSDAARSGRGESGKVPVDAGITQLAGAGMVGSDGTNSFPGTFEGQADGNNTSHAVYPVSSSGVKGDARIPPTGSPHGGADLVAAQTAAPTATGLDAVTADTYGITVGQPSGSATGEKGFTGEIPPAERTVDPSAGIISQHAAEVSADMNGDQLSLKIAVITQKMCKSVKDAILYRRKDNTATATDGRTGESVGNATLHSQRDDEIPQHVGLSADNSSGLSPGMQLGQQQIREEEMVNEVQEEDEDEPQQSEDSQDSLEEGRPAKEKRGRTASPGKEEKRKTVRATRRTGNPASRSTGTKYLVPLICRKTQEGIFFLTYSMGTNIKFLTPSTVEGNLSQASMMSKVKNYLGANAPVRVMPGIGSRRVVRPGRNGNKVQLTIDAFDVRPSEKDLELLANSKGCWCPLDWVKEDSLLHANMVYTAEGISGDVLIEYNQQLATDFNLFSSSFTRLLSLPLQGKGSGPDEGEERKRKSSLTSPHLRVAMRSDAVPAAVAVAAVSVTTSNGETISMFPPADISLIQDSGATVVNE
ncbi:hypothetical protein CBR_g17657 [Chara braunii]|uniref:Uncharacterized protein n=1 Tax=Chara braunii TaxID=69332 RepID=A0A388KVD8_CHABU|nr:hypothetical protein CBR_g17657 [Chara braunii]|eukprot:GBG73942.1 hypothetical protein CBR_g17657 [Chara braunii]